MLIKAYISLKFWRILRKIEGSTYYNIVNFLNQAYAAFTHEPGFLKSIWFTRWYVCIFVSAPEGINK